MLHAFGCERLPRYEAVRAAGDEVVYSTTYGEIEAYAWEQVGEDGWLPCPHCGG
jgi:hypothetical protein